MVRQESINCPEGNLHKRSQVWSWLVEAVSKHALQRCYRWKKRQHWYVIRDKDMVKQDATQVSRLFAEEKTRREGKLSFLPSDCELSVIYLLMHSRRTQGLRRQIRTPSYKHGSHRHVENLKT